MFRTVRCSCSLKRFQQLASRPLTSRTNRDGRHDDVSIRNASYKASPNKTLEQFIHSSGNGAVPKLRTGTSISRLRSTESRPFHTRSVAGTKHWNHENDKDRQHSGSGLNDGSVVHASIARETNRNTITHDSTLNYLVNKSRISEADRDKLYDHIHGYVGSDFPTMAVINQIRNGIDCLFLDTQRGTMMPGVGALDHDNKHLHLGWHQLFFQPDIVPHDLLLDGTDLRFLPGPVPYWPFRLWVSGSIEMQTPVPITVPASRSYKYQERVIKIVTRPNQTFVKVEKSVFREPIQTTTPRHEPESPEPSIETAAPDIVEEYTLCFFAEAPFKETSPLQIVSPNKQPLYTRTLKLSRHLLFLWSSVTKNAHLIHLDSHFAQHAYSATDTLVQGTLQVLLACESLRHWVREAVFQPHHPQSKSNFFMKSIRYKCLAPWYHFQEIRVCARPLDESGPGGRIDGEGCETTTMAEDEGVGAQKWEIWFERNGDTGNEIVFTATVAVDWDRG